MPATKITTARQPKATPATRTRAESGTLRIRKVGNSLGVTFPKAILDRHGLRVGSSVLLVETPDGLLIKPHDADFAEAMALYEDVAERYKNALRELAR